MSAPLIVGVAVVWLGAMAALARGAARRARSGRPLGGGAWTYALATCIFTTGWSWSGQVGLAAEGGFSFIARDLGVSLGMILAWALLRRLVAVARAERVGSIPELLARRFGPRTFVGPVAALVAAFSSVPFVLAQFESIAAASAALYAPPGSGTRYLELGVVAAVLTVFAILLGGSRADAGGRRPGLVFAAAVDGAIRLGLIVVAAVVTLWLAGGIPVGELALPLRVLDPGALPSARVAGFAAALGFFAVPRMFHVMVVENVDPAHTSRLAWWTGAWLFVVDAGALVTAAVGSRLAVGGDPDTWYTVVPTHLGAPALALMVLLAGVSASVFMVAFEAVAVSTILCDALLLPAWLGARRYGDDPRDQERVFRRLRLALVVLLVGGAALFSGIRPEPVPLGELGALSIGLAVQLAPAWLGALLWTRAGGRAASAGMIVGAAALLWTLGVPVAADAGWLSPDLLARGPLGLAWLRPEHLLGTSGLDRTAHALAWSLGLNTAVFAAMSLATARTRLEEDGAERVEDATAHALRRRPRPGTTVGTVEELLARFVGADEAHSVMASASPGGAGPDAGELATTDQVVAVEDRLSKVIGGAAAGLVAGSLLERRPETGETRAVFDAATEALATQRSHDVRLSHLEEAATEIQALNAALEERAEALARTNAELEGFAYSVSHDLRAPLRAITGFSAALAEDAGERLTPDDKALLDRVRAAAARMSRQIEGLLALSRVGRAEMVWTRVDLSRIAGTVAEQLREAEPGRKVEFIAEPGLVVEGDPRLMETVLENLLGNAWKFTRGRDPAHIAFGRADTGEFFVRDDGVGFDQSQAERLFHPFQRLHPDVEGTGVGLATVARIVARHGGKVRATARPGEGATFWFTLGRPEVAPPPPSLPPVMES